MGQKTTIPELRFPDFDDDWENLTMRDISSINQGLQIPIADRLTEKTEGAYFYITNEFLRAGAKKSYYIVNPSPSVTCVESDILMTRTGNTGMVVTGVSGAFHNNFFKITYKDSIARFFLYYFLTHHRTQHTLLKLAGTSTIPDLNHGDFYRISIAVPSLSEQRKIADFLTAVDGRIGQLIQKKALLEDYKKGVMQQLFTQAIRFKDDHGNDFPDWEEKRLGELCSTLRSGKGITAERISDEGKYPVYGGNGLRGYTDTFTHDCELVLIGRQGALCGNINRSSGKAYVSEHAVAVIGNDHSVGEWLAQRLDFMKLNRLSESSAQPGLSVNKLARLKLNTPTVLEQKKIADFLSATDSKIESVASQITETQTFKRGLLQQMFV